MTHNILNTDRPEEVFSNLRAARRADIRLAALLVTLLLHGLVFWWGINSARFSAPSREKMQAIRVFLQPLELPRLAAPPRNPGLKPPRAAGPAAAPPLAPVPREISPPTPPVASAPVPGPGPAVVNAPEAPPAPPVATSMAPLPVAAVGAVPTPLIGGADSPGSKTVPVAATAFSGGGPAGVTGDAAAVAAVGNGAAGTGKELYLQRLFTHIEAHKFYPPSARRRHLEGQVRVSFTIDAAGGVSDLKVAEGHPQLEEAALQTVRSALPLPLPGGGVPLPFSLSYRMDFRLR